MLALLTLLLTPTLVSSLPPTAYGCKSTCRSVFDGRVPNGATGASFDNGALPYNNLYNLGAGLKWADVLKFPKVPTSLFDNSTTKAVEVTIDDRSIFTPSPSNAQIGFRRAELLPQPANVTDAVTGIKTLHWSMRTDTTQPLNYTHEYQLVWLESQDYSANQFVVGTGILYGNTGSSKAGKVIRVQGTNAAGSPKTIWQTQLTDNTWHNIGLTLNYNANTLQVLYSTNGQALQAKTAFVSNNLSNLGQYHFGVLKKPTGPATDITKQGYQPKGIHEGIVYGGIFGEESAGGCVSLKPC